MPENPQPVEAGFSPERHLDLNADLHLFFDLLLPGKQVLDVGAGLGRSRARLRHARQVLLYDPSPWVADQMDFTGPDPPSGPFEVVTAFEVLEHVRDDRAFLALLGSRARQAVFLTSPNWYIRRCQSRHHVREYTHEELATLVLAQWPKVPIRWFVYYKDAEGGWGEMLPFAAWREHRGLKHMVLIALDLTCEELNRIDRLFLGWWVHGRIRGCSHSVSS